MTLRGTEIFSAGRGGDCWIKTTPERFINSRQQEVWNQETQIGSFEKIDSECR